MCSLSLSLDTLLSSSPLYKSHHLHHHHHPISVKSLYSPPPPPSNTTTTSSSAFLDPISLHRLRTLDSFNLSNPLPHAAGSIQIRPVAPDEVGPAVALLAESFVDSLWMPNGYVKLLEILVRQYVDERRRLMPHAVMLVGFYKEEEEREEEELACTAEVSFDARGANAAPPTPLPPKNCPYICNMTVKKTLRR